MSIQLILVLDIPTALFDVLNGLLLKFSLSLPFFILVENDIPFLFNEQALGK